MTEHDEQEPEGYEDLFGDLTTTQKIGCVIGNELSLIRAELTRLRQIREAQLTDTPDNRPVYDCQRCEQVLRSEDRAKQHARREHGAVDDLWRDLYPDA